MIMRRKENTKDRTSVNISLLLVLLAAAFAAGIFIGRGTWLFGANDRSGEFFRPLSEEFRFIRQSVKQETAAEGSAVKELKPFRYKVNTLIEEKLADGDAAFIAVYFRDLDNGNRFGIREQETFSPEAQPKLPLMIAYFKWAEDNPLVLRKKLAYRAQTRSQYRILTPRKRIEPGASYTVNDLIFRMIVYGDNDAYDLLATNLPAKHLQRIYKDLYVNYDPAKPVDSFSLSAYASFFRVLFNASYLSEELSEKALRYLSRSSFRGGMAAAVPDDVDLASKSGERVFRVNGPEQDDEVLQLHEIGIVYHANRPFLLGVTVRGEEAERLTRIIRDITRLIYTEIANQSD
jgi:beta-lactamase class A